jgi:hypothetical protein
MKIDCLYQLFVTHLGCSLFKLRGKTYDSNHCSFICFKCRGLARALNIVFNDFQLSPSFFTGLNSNFPCCVSFFELGP